MPFAVRNPTPAEATHALFPQQMVVINDKLPPPPPYHTALRPLPNPSGGPTQPSLPSSIAPTQLYPPPFHARQTCQSLVDLPPHILLQIIYTTCPDDVPLERLRRRLYWVAMYLRLTCRALYIGSMHLLRSTYLPLYLELVRRPYTSDPFPFGAPAQFRYISTPTIPSLDPLTAASNAFSVPSLQSIQRETAVLDRFLVLKICDDVRADETEFHLGSEDAFTDLFDLMQPRGRLEDLVRLIGVQTGVIAQEDEVSSARRGRCKKLVFDTLSINFSPRKLSLVQTDRSRRKRTLVEIQRSKTETLEVSAKRLIRALIAQGVVPDPSSSPAVGSSSMSAGFSPTR